MPQNEIVILIKFYKTQILHILLRGGLGRARGRSFGVTPFGPGVEQKRMAGMRT